MGFYRVIRELVCGCQLISDISQCVLIRFSTVDEWRILRVLVWSPKQLMTLKPLSLRLIKNRHSISTTVRILKTCLNRTRKPQKYDNSGVLWNCLVGPDGLEPPTKGLWVPCSNQLSYGPEVPILYPIVSRNQAVPFLEAPYRKAEISAGKTIDGFPSCAA